MEIVKPTFMQRLQYVQAELAGIVQCAEVSILVNCDYYHPQVSLPDALYAITEAINAWEDCQHDDMTVQPEHTPLFSDFDNCFEDLVHAEPE